MLLQDHHQNRTDPVFALADACEADLREGRLDLLLGVYRDDELKSPVMGAVREAEQRLAERSASKRYSGPAGSAAFVTEMESLILDDRALIARSTSIQTLGGTGALRLLADFLKRSGKDRTVFVGEPAYVNHAAILTAAGLRVQTFPTLGSDGRLDAEAMLRVIESAREGDVLLLQGCCHNPTGASIPLDLWKELAVAFRRNGVVPFIDQAYFGLGDGIETDLQGMQALLRVVPSAVVAVSGSKAWGLYSERVGCAIVVSDPAIGGYVRGELEHFARVSYTQPPSHGADIVLEVLGTPQLRTDWRAELDQMRLRLTSLREELVSVLVGAAPDAGLETLRTQRGMFLYLPLDETQMQSLREEHAIHGLPSGRISLSGIPRSRLESVGRAIAGLAVPSTLAAV